MKKKFRDIIVDGEHWAWTFYAKGDYHEDQYVKIWDSKKKVVFDRNFSLNTDFKWSKENKNKRYKITPGLISRFIKIYLRHEKHTLGSTK